MRIQRLKELESLPKVTQKWKRFAEQAPGLWYCLSVCPSYQDRHELVGQSHRAARLLASCCMVPFVLLRMCFLSLLPTHPTPRAVLVLGKHLGHFNLCSAHIRVLCA